MNMDVSNDELKELLERFMNRLDKMDKERDVMKKKLDRMHNHIKNVNKALDELYYSMGEEETVELNISFDELEHIKSITKLIQDDKMEFLDDEEFESIGRPKEWGVLPIRPMGATIRFTSDRRLLIRNTAEMKNPYSMSKYDLEKRKLIHLKGLILFYFYSVSDNYYRLHKCTFCKRLT